MYIYMYDCTSTEGSAHMTIHILSNICVHVHVHIYVYMSTEGQTCCAHTCTCMTILILSNIHIHVYVHIYV